MLFYVKIKMQKLTCKGRYVSVQIRFLVSFSPKIITRFKYTILEI